MITKAAGDFHAALLQKSKEYDQMATYAARSYAEGNKQIDQDSYRKNSELCDIFRKLASEACQFMHAIEAEMVEYCRVQEGNKQVNPSSSERGKQA